MKITVNAVKEFKGHEGEPLIQCNVLLNGKKVAFFSEDSWGGPARLDATTKANESKVQDIIDYCTSLDDRNYAENYHIIITGIADKVITERKQKRQCKTKTLVQEHSNPDAYDIWNMPWSINTADRLVQHFDKEYGKGKYTIINEHFEDK